ncbi:MAG: LysR family transcriptional regulator [Pseudomonadales bacterium]
MAPVPAFELDWNLVRTFVAVADGGSLAAASRQLGLAHPTVARHIQQLEERLGLVLFDRTSHGLNANADGARLAAQALAMQREAIAFKRLSESVREQPMLQVRVTVSELMLELIPPMLAPGLGPAGELATSVEFIVANEQLNLLERQADLAVRHVRPQQQDLICRRLGAVAMIACASKSYLERHPAPLLTQPERHWFIDGATRSRFRNGAASVGLHFSDEQIAFRSESMLAQRSAALAGWGVAALPETMLRVEPELVALADGAAAVDIEVWLVARPEIRNARQLKTAYDSLGDLLSAHLVQLR